MADNNVPKIPNPAGTNNAASVPNAANPPAQPKLMPAAPAPLPQTVQQTSASQNTPAPAEDSNTLPLTKSLKLQRMLWIFILGVLTIQPIFTMYYVGWISVPISLASCIILVFRLINFNKPPRMKKEKIEEKKPEDSKDNEKKEGEEGSEDGEKKEGEDSENKDEEKKE